MSIMRLPVYYKLINVKCSVLSYKWVHIQFLYVPLVQVLSFAELYIWAIFKYLTVS